MKRNLATVFAFLGLLAIPALYNACGMADFRFAGDGGTSSAGSTGGNPMLPLTTAPFTPARVYHACLGGVQGRLVDGTIVPLPISKNEIEIRHDGTVFGSFDFPNGDYEKIYIWFESGCPASATLPAGASFVMANGNGTFGTGSMFRFTFYGIFKVADPIDRSLLLDMSLIVNELEAVASNADVPVKAQAQGGSITFQ